MKISDLDNTIKVTDLENFFDIHQDDRGNNVYNLNKTVYLVVGNNYETYTLTTDAFWPLISYKIYDTTHLAWLLMKVNDVKPTKIFTKKRAGDVIKYIPIEKVQQILEGF